MLSTIGPVWDGNEVWLVVAGGATFAAFPAWYATMFSGFYLALLLLLVFLIVRVVSFEWREKERQPALASAWAWANTIGSIGPRLSGASRFSNLALRRPARLRAATSPATSGTSSAPYTAARRDRGRAAVRVPRRDLPRRCGRPATLPARCGGRGGSRSRPPLVGAGVPRSGRSWSRSTATTRTSSRPCSRRRSRSPRSLGAVVFVRRRSSGWAFAAHRGRRRSARRHALHEPLPARHGLEPRLRATASPSTTPSSAHYTLAVMTVVALIVTPLILLYQGWTYYVFRARITAPRCGSRAARAARGARPRGRARARPAPRAPRTAGADAARARRALGVATALLVLAQAT